MLFKRAVILRIYLSKMYLAKNDPSIVQLNPTAPSWQMSGRQNIGEGTFESTFGRSPRDYDFVHLYRWIGGAEEIRNQHSRRFLIE